MKGAMEEQRQQRLKHRPNGKRTRAKQRAFAELQRGGDTNFLFIAIETEKKEESCLNLEWLALSRVGREFHWRSTFGSDQTLTLSKRP